MSRHSPFTGPNSTAALLTDVIGQGINLAKGELALAKAEAALSAQAALSTIAKMVVAAVLSLAALNMLAAAAVAGLLALEWSLVAATVTVGLGLIVLAAGFGLYARAQIKTAALTPERVLRRMAKNANTFSDMVK